MSSADAAKAPSKSKTKDKAKKTKSSSGGGGGSQPQDRLKTIVRRLPPNLPEDVFWQSVASWVSDETVSWKVYYPGKFKTRCVISLARV